MEETDREIRVQDWERSGISNSHFLLVIWNNDEEDNQKQRYVLEMWKRLSKFITYIQEARFPRVASLLRM